jgi:hypothetical protein
MKMIAIFKSPWPKGRSSNFSIFVQTERPDEAEVSEEIRGHTAEKALEFA